MHICFLCNEYPPGKHGGVGSFTQTLARALAARGHKVTVTGFYRAEHTSIEDDQGVSVIRLPHSPLPRTGFIVNGLRLRRSLHRVHQESPIDVLEGPENSLSLVPAAFSAAKVIRMHGGHHFFMATLGKRPKAWRSWIERRSFARADQLCAVSRFVAETTRALLGLTDRPIEVLPNPVDTTLFRPQPDELEEAGLIFFGGTVCEKKGIRQLIQAMPHILKAFPEARLVVAGRDWHDAPGGGSFTEYLRGTIPPDLRARILFKGAVEHALLPDLIAKAAVCVYPSHMEAMPLVWLEALAMGKAVVASKTGPGPEVIADGVSGLLCDPHDPQSIADKIIALLKDDGLRRYLGRQARERAVNSFSESVLVERNEAFYRRCIQEHKETEAHAIVDRRDNNSLPA